MSLVIGTIVVIVLVAFFSALLGMLVAATIGIRRSDRGHYRALRNGRYNRTFSGAGRSWTGLRFPDNGSVPDDTDAEGNDQDVDEDDSHYGRPKAVA